MAASHFFVGLGAGIAILAVPVLTLTPGMDLPHRFAAWIDGPAPQPAQTAANTDVVSRPRSGYKPGDPTPAAESPPTLEPVARPTPVAQVLAPVVQPPPGAMRTGVIQAAGAPVYVRRAAGVESPGDPLLADGSPVLVSTGGATQVSGQPWRAVRALNGIVGWVPGAQVVVDGEAPPVPVMVGSSPTPGPRTAPNVNSGTITVGGAPLERLKVANTDGVGVVLRSSPRDQDKTHIGLMEGAGVSVVERSGADWVHVRADNGQEGWVPSRYLAP